MNVIEVQDVSKKFRLGAATGDLRERVGALFSRRTPVQKTDKDFWALHDISFAVAEGESFGIIGHNGSGKSTLLKLITGIYTPTKGTFKTRGRISALIEVGAGFHPDLTGRENVYMNGSVMGMKKREIDKRFDEIVSFSELEQFIDTPVKRYSSGMYMRLGFAVAAHIDPDIVLVDEVLAVGDEAFQRKCTRKMHELRGAGKTIVFISHAMGSVLELCQRVMVLSHGRMLGIGEPREIIDIYRNSVATEGDVRRDGSHSPGTAAPRGALPIQILSVRVANEQGDRCEAIPSGGGVRLECDYRAHQTVDDAVLGLSLQRPDGLLMYGVNTELDKTPVGPLQAGEGRFSVWFPSLPVAAGVYTFSVSIGRAVPEAPGTPTLLDRRDGDSLLTVLSETRSPGVVHLEHRWELSDAQLSDAPTPMPPTPMPPAPYRPHLAEVSR